MKGSCHCNGILPLSRWLAISALEGGPKDHMNQTKIVQSFRYAPRAFHYFLSFTNCRATFTVIPLLPKATSTPLIQHNLSIPYQKSTYSVINKLLAIRYSSILSTCPNHLNTHWSNHIANTFLFVLFYAPLHSWLDTFVIVSPNFLKTSSQEHSLPLSQHFWYPLPLHRTTPLVQFVLLHIDTFSQLSPLQFPTHFSALPTPYTPHSFCVPHPFHVVTSRKWYTVMFYIVVLLQMITVFLCSFTSNNVILFWMNIYVCPVK